MDSSNPYTVLYESSSAEGIECTQAMPVRGVGCILRVTNTRGSTSSEAVTFVPGARIQKEHDGEGKFVGYILAKAGQKSDELVVCENGCCLQTRFNPYAECENIRFQIKERK